MTAETKRSVWLALGQVALVVLSVGLGLAVGEWRQSRADAARAAQAVDGAVREIARNQRRAADAIIYHDELFEALESGETQSVQLRPAFLVDNAWETAQAAGVVPDLPYPVVEALAAIHDTQTTYQRLAELNIGLLYFGNIYSGAALPSDAKGYASSVSDLRLFERELVAQYGAALAAIDAAGFAVADSLLAAP